MSRIAFPTIVLVICMAAGTVFAADPDFAKMESDTWAAARDKDFAAVTAKFAPGYQSVDERHIMDRKAAIEALKKYNLSDFTLSDFKVTRTGDGAVLTYMVEVTETVDGKRVAKRKTPRASVWIKTDKGWLTLFHGNFNPLKK